MTSADDSERFTIHFERTLRAPPGDVFDAWTRPEQIAEWWDPTGAKLVHCEIDLRPGGAFTFENAGHSVPFSGVYRLIERPSKLVFDALGSVGTVSLEAEGQGTRMRVSIRCASAEHYAHFLKVGVETNTAITLDNLVEHIRRRHS